MSADTRVSLLVRIKDSGDEQAWEEFNKVYQPLLFGYFMKHNLQPADAEDLSQDVMRTIIKNIENFEYDPKKGSFRAWLKAVSRNKAINFLKHSGRKSQGSGRTTIIQFVENQPSEETEEDFEWDKEYRKRLFEWASEFVKKEVSTQTWQAFWMSSIEEKSGEEISETLGLSPGAVYSAKCRVLARLKKRIEYIADEWPI